MLGVQIFTPRVNRDLDCKQLFYVKRFYFCSVMQKNIVVYIEQKMQNKLIKPLLKSDQQCLFNMKRLLQRNDFVHNAHYYFTPSTALLR